MFSCKDGYLCASMDMTAIGTSSSLAMRFLAVPQILPAAAESVGRGKGRSIDAVGTVLARSRTFDGCSKKKRVMDSAIQGIPLDGFGPTRCSVIHL